MIDVSDFPFPDDAPEPGTCVKVLRPEQGLAVIVLDPPHRQLTVLDAPLLRDLASTIDEIARDKELRGVVITGRQPDEFAAGADIKSIERLDDPAKVESLVREVHALFAQIERLPPTTVAAVGGAVPGGALELSLACDYIVATDSPGTRIGLPETQLGIVPGWGGCHRLPKRIGVPAALTAILTGRLYAAKPAQKLGIVDRLAKSQQLVQIASDIALGRRRCARRVRGWRRLLVDRNPIARSMIRSQALKQSFAKTRGHYPAIPAAIDLVVGAPGATLRRMADREAAAVAELATGTVCKSLIAVFFGMEDAKKLGRSADGQKPAAVERAGILGAGVMGGGLASLCAEKGLGTRLMDVSLEALDRAQHEHRAVIKKKLRRRRLQRHEAAAAGDRLEVATELVGFQRCEIVVEAVAERIDVKREVMGKLATQVGSDTILATNTSSLSVDAIADGLPAPERVCGMHFFNPVRAMPLVEIVRGSRTRDDVVTAVAALAIRLGKSPVVVADVAGFLVNRILGPYLDEALRLFVGGANVEHVDRVMLDFGMPMGPFALLDEVGLDIAGHAAKSLREAYGPRMEPCDGLDALSGEKRLGKKTGLGFYRHPKSGKKVKPEPAPDLGRFQPGTWASELTDAAIADRLVLSMVNEAARCLDEGVVPGPRELDLATVLGTGFAPFRGGLLRYADSIGLKEIRGRLRAIAASLDVAERGEAAKKFAPAELIEVLAEEGKGFHDGFRREPGAVLEPVTS